MADTVEYTAQEVAKHKSPNDVWMTIHGKVYDVTKYLDSHPGGLEVLTEAAGTDASEEFDNAGHSEDAFEIMADLCVGTLKNAKKKKAVRLQSIALVSLGTAALSYGAVKYSSQIPLHLIKNVNLPSLPTSLSIPALQRGGPSSEYGFVKGFLIGASVLTVANTLLAQSMLNMIRKETNFLDYPAHYRVPKAIESDILLRRGWLSSTSAPLTLTKKMLIAPNVYRLIFDLPSPDAIVGLPTGQHVAITANVDGETITRSYTPVSNNSDIGTLELVIKVYPDGKLTNGYLAKLNEGDEVQFRGPKGAMRYTRGLCKKIGMLAGGTGITPMFQLIRAICENDRDATEISLLYANRTEQDILLREELDAYARKYPKVFKVYYLLDQPPADWQFGSGYVTKDMMAERFPTPSDDTKIMLCGPPGMVNAAKKSLVDLGFKQPSAMSKITDQIFSF
ncbi:NADH-cytochrome b5 reductase 1 [Cladobotryum mycophilum]|uniref:NADH-cytochrome b5 reductase 1 n=1 Tax=Cladobotryum mycophilum TaxID=491253 RepID=A0ABR0SBP2_9HYPO